MIYTKTNAHHPQLDRAFFKNLSEAKLENDSVYWYDQHDHVIRGTPFPVCIDDQHWEHLRNDPTSKILMYYGDEYFNILDINDWVNTLKLRNINPAQVYLVTTDENWVRWATDRLAERDIVGVNIQSVNILMGRVKEQEYDPEYTYRFSSLSRNFTDWRLNIYAEFCNRDLLQHFNYTFSNICPYGNIITTEHDELTRMINSMGYDTSSEKFKSWIAGIPYQIPDHPILEKLAKGTYDFIKSSGIHFLIESHFDPFWTTMGLKGTMTPYNLSPAFPTEKTYKALSCRRPFIIFSTPQFLKEFKELGYETFHPYINESYDEIEDDKTRLMAIADEVERISKLSSEEFDVLLKNCEPIAKRNFDLFVKKKSEISFNNRFQWITPYLAAVPGQAY
jgi:hypothetical protein